MTVRPKHAAQIKMTRSGMGRAQVMLSVVEIALEKSALGIKSLGETDELPVSTMAECDDGPIVDCMLQFWCSFVLKARWNRQDDREV
jgi:hypothetical protein